MTQRMCEEGIELTVTFDKGCDNSLGSSEGRCSSVAVSIDVSDKNFECQEQCRGLPVRVRLSAAVGSCMRDNNYREQ